MVEYRCIPEIAGVVCIKHTFECMSTEGTQGDAKKPRRTCNHQCSAATHYLLIGYFPETENSSGNFSRKL